MSLIHLEKSILSFHLKEILEDGQVNHPLTWLGLGVLIFGPKLLPTFVKGSQPVNPKLVNQTKSTSGYTQISLSQWIAVARKRELEAHKQKGSRGQEM
ncbi:hypothetical protein [Planktothrix mougeotii]|uniref:Uncharacterized protein n=1 Tax=Planktothrix mougeotii LEGE 06226 TaxID=1828728 RepID=A0ABR9U9A5_9CYAN|nr:hypothetical protein [Planktothrix mougeotii]MBE9143032.1 hypothetical protein [Planktothrix mougeotii LEGE 06226]